MVSVARTAKQIDRLIINSPYEEPRRYWSYDRVTQTFSLVEGERRPAGYVVATEGSKAFDDPGQFFELPLVNRIRPRVKVWREAGWPGVTSITRRLLDHWTTSGERDHPFFFCQVEAIETLIWLVESSAAERQGIVVPGDGGPFTRLCAKMATGSGKTIVMSMVIAWQVLNKVAAKQDRRFSKDVLVIAPGLTVKNRLQVLYPAAEGSYYEIFNIVPPALRPMLRQGRVLVHNWHKLDWETAQQLAKRRSVDKRGAKSDEAYARGVLEHLSNARNLVVLNDEAHHAWRLVGDTKGISKEEVEEATKWVGGLDRIHAARGISTCFDFSATPFPPTGKKTSEESLFGWVVSDFGLNDAIESGLVKTPRVVVRDDGVPDAKTYRSKLYHIYADRDVKDDLNRKADASEPLPDLVTNAYYLLGKDWLETSRDWTAAGHHVPPVMITVANRTETAARIEYAFQHKKVRIDELCDPERMLRIDSKVLSQAEAQEQATADAALMSAEDDGNEDDEAPVRKESKRELAERLRRTVDTVGQRGQLGERIHSVISVQMLSEGWDAKTVTHIMGLRAFTSQLLCEQVVGRGLRRTSYEVGPDGLFEAEHVNIFGVPFTFLPHESKDGPPPPPPPPKTRIEPDASKSEFALRWPNILKIEHVFRPRLTLDLARIPVLELNAADVKTIAQLAPTVEGKPDLSKVDEIQLAGLVDRFRLQRIVFETAREICDGMQGLWRGPKVTLMVQVVGIVEQVFGSDRISILPKVFEVDEVRRRLVLMLSMNRVQQHLRDAIRFENAEKLVPVFDTERPIRGTGDMYPWHTSRPCERAKKSHINFAVFDSTWEASEAYTLDESRLVTAWAKNDHLGFEILYTFAGGVRKYQPDYLVRLANDVMLVLEVKGQDSEENRIKRRYLDEWIEAVNLHGGFGRWVADVSFDPADVHDILTKHVPGKAKKTA